MGEDGVIRVNVSVQRELKARMDSEKGAVNWSAVASQAFEAKLLELASKKGGETMEDVIARMKAADELDEHEDYHEGVAAGEAWVKDVARPKQLRNLVNSLPNNTCDVGNALSTYAINNGIAFQLFMDIEGKDGQECQAFWERVLGEGGWEKIEEFNFAYGFVDGALKIWEQIEDRI